jgi:hypothetical protein
MSSQNSENPETTETGEGGGYGEPTPEQELGQQAGPGRQDNAGRQENGDRQDSEGGQEAAEDRAGEQQDPVTGEGLRPGQAESPG